LTIWSSVLGLASAIGQAPPFAGFASIALMATRTDSKPPQTFTALAASFTEYQKS